MANLDSRSKRASSVNFLKPYTLDLALPDGAIGQGDRQHSAWAYSGILASGAAAVVTMPDNAAFIKWQDRRTIVKFRDKRTIVKGT